MLPGSSTSLTALFHGCGSHLKLLECVVDGTGGRVRSTTPAEDRYIVPISKRNRRTTAQRVANQFLAASGKAYLLKTVARRLRGGGLYVRRPVVCVPLTRQHRTAHLQWCREHHNWTEQDWACVLFSDESRFSLSSDCRCQLIWRESGTAFRPENIQEKDRYPTCSIIMWAGIMINGRTRLHVVANGTMTGQRYIDEVLLLHVRLFRGAVGDKFVFMDDNATCHRTLSVQDCLDSEGIQRLVWSARSPDLNPYENVWEALGRQVAGRNYPPTNKNTLIRALTEEWDKLPHQLQDNLVQKSDQRSERPQSTRNAVVVEKVENLIMEGRRLTVRETAEQLVPLVTAEGLEEDLILLLQFHLGIAFSVGCGIFGILLVKKNAECIIGKQYLCQAAMITMGLGLLSISAAQGYYGLVLFSWMYGVPCGGLHYSLKMLVFEKIRAKSFSRAWAYVEWAQSIPVLVGIPAAAGIVMEMWYRLLLFAKTFAPIVRTKQCSPYTDPFDDNCPHAAHSPQAETIIMRIASIWTLP
ncbi:transposable element Tcb2 transposase [Trichonephila clavipes]|nr:transposable element Tcb2 transposase [Trichonephila clavipes]